MRLRRWERWWAMRGGDGVGECLCDLSDRGRPFTRRWVALGRRCWACQPRENRHDVVRAVIIPQPDEANAYDPLDGSTPGAAFWLPLHEDGSVRSAEFEACDTVQAGDAAAYLDYDHDLGLDRRQRPHLNPTARDVWHLRTGERWYSGAWWWWDSDDWQEEPASGQWSRMGWPAYSDGRTVRHEWGDENIRAMAQQRREEAA